MSPATRPGAVDRPDSVARGDDAPRVELTAGRLRFVGPLAAVLVGFCLALVVGNYV